MNTNNPLAVEPETEMIAAAKILLPPVFWIHLDCSGELRDNAKDFLK